VADGGRSALCGFLWQFMGAAAIVAMGECQGDDPHTPELDALVRAARQSGVHGYSEPFDQDLSLIDESDRRVERRCILTQFKYSRNQTANTVMDRGDIDDVINRLDASAREARIAGYQPVAYVLVTNQAITRDGTAGHERAQQIPPNIDLFMTSQPVPAQPLLYTARGPSMQEWVNRLRDFARRFGLDSDEIDDGIDRLMGHLLSVGGGATQVNAALDRRSFTRAFTGSTDTQPLTAGDVAPHSRESIARLRPHWQTETPLVRRYVLDEIIERARSRALVVVYGPGGCGKTATLLQWADATMESVAATTGRPVYDSGAFVALEGANRVQANWISKVIGAWGNWSTGSRLYSDDRDRVWGRLRAANLDADLPLLRLGLDGLDEDADSDLRKDGLRDILRWFWDEDVEATGKVQRPRMTLVVTCREGATIVEDVLRLRRHGVPGAPSFAQIRIGDFSEPDLRQVVALLPLGRHEIRRRLEEAVDLVDGPQEDDNDDAGLLSAAAVTPAAPQAPGVAVDPDIYTALKHPATWDAFYSLDVESQEGVLDGSRESTMRLARAIVRRACTKAHERHSSIFPDTDDLILVLRDVAQKIAYTTTAHPYAAWRSALDAGGVVTGSAVLRLYKEAESAGLIVEDVRLALWRWRHTMVWEALAMGTDEEWGRP